MKIEDLTIKLEMSDEALKAQKKILKKAFTNEFGFWGTIILMMKVIQTAKRIRKEHPETISKARKLGKNPTKELVELTSLFLVLSKKMGKPEAYNFMRYKIIVPTAKISMPDIYQIDKLKQCEGEIFDNFKKYNVQLFKETTRQGTWKVEKFNESDDLLHFKVLNCANIELFNELGVPELGYFACHHDLAGYPIIEPIVDCEFRRPKTIADGVDYCHFHFYRKGTAPDNAHLNK